MKISYSLSRWMSLLAFVLCGFEANAETATLWVSGVSADGGWYDVNEHWRLRLAGKYKHAGIFHMNAHYYAAEVRLGAEYKF